MKIVKSLIVTFAVIVTLLGTANALSYADDAISELLSLEIIVAMPETPEVSVTREEFCVMLSKLALLDGGRVVQTENIEAGAFADENDITAESYPYVMYLYNEGVLLGSPGDEGLYLLPATPITRQDAAVLVSRRLKLGSAAEDSNVSRFNDGGDISPYADSSVSKLLGAGIVRGYPDGSFKPQNYLTLAEAAVIINNALDNVNRGLRTYFGSGIIGDATGTANETKFAMPAGVCFDNAGNLLVFDTYNSSIKSINNAAAEIILGSSDTLDDYGFAKPLYRDGKRQVALFGRPTDGVCTENGDLFIVDSANDAIRLVRGNTVYTFAGGSNGFADGLGESARFNRPTAITADENGNLYVADTYNHCIRMISPDGTVKTIAGVPETSGYLDAAADSALLCEPSGLAFGENGALYIADTGNHTIRKLENGVITTAAGAAGDFEPDGDYRTGGFSDGLCQIAEFRFPTGLCFAEGTLFIADTGNNSIRALGADGVVTTIAGNGDAGDTDGLPELATMNKPLSIAYRGGVIYIADSLNNKIKALPVT